MSTKSNNAIRYSQVRSKQHNNKNIESTISLSKDIKNTLLIDTVAFKFQKKNYTCLEKNYDSIVMVRNEMYLFHKLMCRPASISASQLTSKSQDHIRLPEPR